MKNTFKALACMAALAIFAVACNNNANTEVVEDSVIEDTLVEDTLVEDSAAEMAAVEEEQPVKKTTAKPAAKEEPKANTHAKTGDAGKLKPIENKVETTSKGDKPAGLQPIKNDMAKK